jgi:hypothetical protein
MRCGSTTTLQITGTPDIASQKEVRNSTIGGKRDVEASLVYTRVNLEHYQERGTTVNNVRYSEMLRDQFKQLLESNSEDYCQKLSQCCMIMHVRTLPKASAN